jgi:hypothetical protein
VPTWFKSSSLASSTGSMTSCCSEDVALGAKAAAFLPLLRTKPRTSTGCPAARARDKHSSGRSPVPQRPAPPVGLGPPPNVSSHLTQGGKRRLPGALATQAAHAGILVRTDGAVDQGTAGMYGSFSRRNP